ACIKIFPSDDVVIREDVLPHPLLESDPPSSKDFYLVFSHDIAPSGLSSRRDRPPLKPTRWTARSNARRSSRVGDAAREPRSASRVSGGSQGGCVQRKAIVI